jgi:sigma-B regulation protein RsbU (phosphoserine phosphatase)
MRMRIRFRARLLIFALSVVLIPTVGLVVYFFSNFNSLTRFSLSQNTAGIERSNQAFLTNLASDKARLTSLQFKRAIDSVTILGKAAQEIVDNYRDLASVPDFFRLKMFRDNLIAYKKALTNPKTDLVNVLIPPSLVAQKRAREMLSVSSLLNLVIGPVFESNENNTFVYFVGDRQSPVTRAFPNINLAEYLGPAIDALFWRDFFQDNVQYWERYYTDEAFRKQVDATVASPLTFDPPYEDAAGQGKIITLFYPLWNHQEGRFGGVVAADVSLAKIVENVLAVRVAKTGYAVLLNGKGEIVAMSGQAEKSLKVKVDEINRNGLVYYYRSLSTSEDAGIRGIYDRIMAERAGYLKVQMDDGEKHVLVFDSLDPINDTQYNLDTWKILINVPEKEILATLFETHRAITAQNARISLISLIVVGCLIVVVILVTFVLSGTITRSIGQLSLAAQKIAQKDYDISLNITSQDEIGELGGAFVQMSREIKGYTEHLEDMVRERTLELEKAMQKISVLNEKLTDENLRLSTELEVAKKLQLMVLPGKQELNQIRDLDVACAMNPADEVGGDYYDCFRTNGSVNFGIGDVTGHGLSAGVIMLMAQTAVRTIALMGERDLKRSLSLVNRVLYSNIERITEDRSMTLSLINYHDRTFTVAGQHECIVIWRNDGRVEVQDTEPLGMFVGFEPDITRFIGERRIRLEPGELIVLYTDGVTEAVNRKGEEFGLRRLCDLVGNNSRFASAQILENLLSELYAFIGEARVHDDISLMVIKQK